MATLLKVLVWWAIWFCGSYLLTDVLQLDGTWLMAGGAFVFTFCEAITNDLFD